MGEIVAHYIGDYDYLCICYPAIMDNVWPTL